MITIINFTILLVNLTISGVVLTVSEKDEQLLALLRDDARMPVSDLARHMGMSRTAVQARLEKLQKNGIITGFGVRLSQDFLRERVRALVMIKAPPTCRHAIEARLEKIPQLSALFSISGAYDLTAVIAAKSVSELDQLIDEVGTLDGVIDTMSSIILSTRIER